MNQVKGLFRVFWLGAIIVVGNGCSQDQREQLYATFVEPTGCVIEQITSEPFDEYQFQGVSRDGNWLSVAWSNGEDEAGNPIRGAYNVHLETGERRDLPETLNNSSSFSPDGQRLIGAHYPESGVTDIYMLDLATNAVEVIAPDSAWDFLPSFAPDGQSILFNSYRSGNSELYLYHQQTDALRQLTNYEGYDAHGEFSPNGLRILFHRITEELEDGGYEIDLHIYDLNADSERQVTTMPGEQSYASWAPDGESFVFSSDSGVEPGQTNLFVLQRDGSVVQLTDNSWPDRYAYWMRDGSYIYFNASRHDNEDIFRIEMDGLTCVKAD